MVERAYRATGSLLKENPRISASVTVHNTQTVGAKALVSAETSPQHPRPIRAL